jgi:hypothetical protein
MSTEITSLPESSPDLPRDRGVVLCGSMRSYELICQTAQRLTEQGVYVNLPPPAHSSRTALTHAEYLRVKRMASRLHFDMIRDPRTWGVLAVNPELDGVASYVGPNAFAELALAFAFRRRIYLLYGVPIAYEDELAAWGAVALKGQLARLTADFRVNAPDQGEPSA